MRDYRDHQLTSKQGARRSARIVRALLIALCLSAGIRWSVHSFILFPFIVPNAEMAPSLRQGQRVYVWHWFDPTQELQRGSLIFLHHPRASEYKLIRRIVALPGEKIVFKKQTIYINANPLADEWVTQWQSRLTINKEDVAASMLQANWIREQQLKANEFFVLAENHKVGAVDSRFFGVVTLDCIEGVIGAQSAKKP